jgi:hypothetical protein
MCGTWFRCKLWPVDGTAGCFFYLEKGLTRDYAANHAALCKLWPVDGMALQVIFFYLEKGLTRDYAANHAAHYANYGR